ncbi:hypothetical protein QBC37DRAFT_265259, partial [Rhypophila decipiens]
AMGVNMPKEAQTPYIRHLRSYFCHAYYFIKPAHRAKSDKFTAHAEKGRLIGYGDLHGKIYWIWNPRTGAIVRANAVRFNEGPDYKPDNDAVAEEYEAVFADTTADELEEATATKITKQVRFAPTVAPGHQPPEQDFRPIEAPVPEEKGDHEQQQNLPTPRATPERDDRPEDDPERDDHLEDNADDDVDDTLSHISVDGDLFFDATDTAELNEEAPVPPDHYLAEHTTLSEEMQQTTAGLPTDQSVGVNPDPDNHHQHTRRSTRQKKYIYGDSNEKDYYKKLNRGKLPAQSLFCGHLVETPLVVAMQYALSVQKVDHLIDLRPAVPKNYTQARKLPNFETY